MVKRFFHLLLFSCLVASTSRAADDGFVGKWKLNPSRSKLTDEMKFDDLGGNKYALDFGSGNPEIIVADGTDQPASFGTTFEITVEGPHRWKAVRKKEGRIQLTGIWELSEDGSTLTDHFTSFQPDGKTFSLDYVYTRTAGRSSGLAGTWESSSEQVNSVYELQVQVYDGDGLSFINSAQGTTRSLKFDGKDYPVVGPNLPAGFVSSGRRMDAGTLEFTDKIDGKTVDSQEVELSPDRKTLTMTARRAGRSKPNVLVFDRE
jgi:hypothetical protein